MEITPLKIAENIKNEVENVNTESKAISLSLGQDIYTCFLLSLEKNIFQNEMNKFEQLGLACYALFAAFVQISGVAIFYNLDFSINASDVEIIYNTDADQSQSFYPNAIINEYSAIKYQPQFGFYEYFTRLIAICILMAYISKLVSEWVSITSILPTVKHLWMFMLLSVFHSVMAAATAIKIVQVINDQTDVINIFSVGVGFIILLEVDDYIYQSVHKTNKWFNDDLFIYTINEEDVKDTIYGNKCCNRWIFTPYTYHIFSSFLLLPSVIISGSLSVYLYNNHPGPDWQIDPVKMIIFMGPLYIPMISPAVFPCILLCKKRCKK